MSEFGGAPERHFRPCLRFRSSWVGRGTSVAAMFVVESSQMNFPLGKCVGKLSSSMRAKTTPDNEANCLTVVVA